MSDNRENLETNEVKEVVIPNPEMMKNLEEIDDKQVKKTIKKENKKAFKKFLAVIIIGGLCGGIVGGLIGYATGHGVLSPEETVKNALFIITPYMLPLILIVGGGIMLYHYRRAKAQYKVWDNEDEYAMNEIEMSISKSMTATTVSSITGLFFMGVHIFSLMQNARADRAVSTEMLIMLGFIIMMFIFVYCQKKLVDFTRVLNPEKKGSVLDTNFQDVWLESCDEAEKLNIYQSAYAAYKFMNVFLIVLWAITMFIAIGFGTGLLAMAMISASWLALNLTYSLKAMKLERMKKND